MDVIKNLLKIRFTAFNKINKDALRDLPRPEINIVFQHFPGKSISEIKKIPVLDPDLSGLHRLMGQFPHLNIGKRCR